MCKFEIVSIERRAKELWFVKVRNWRQGASNRYVEGEGETFELALQDAADKVETGKVEY